MRMRITHYEEGIKKVWILLKKKRRSLLQENDSWWILSIEMGFTQMLVTYMKFLLIRDLKMSIKHKLESTVFELSTKSLLKGKCMSKKNDQVGWITTTIFQWTKSLRNILVIVNLNTTIPTQSLVQRKGPIWTEIPFPQMPTTANQTLKTSMNHPVVVIQNRREGIPKFKDLMKSIWISLTSRTN